MTGYRLLINGCLILCWASIIYAADVDFEVNAGAGYESNVFRSATAPKEDTYFSLGSKIALSLPLDKLDFSSSSRLALEQHLSETVANLQELIFSGLGRYNRSAYMSFGLRDQLIISGQLKSVEWLSDMLGRRDFVDNRISSDLRYDLKSGVLAVSLEYANTIRDYEDNERDNWSAHSGRLQLEYFLGHKTSTQMKVGLMRKAYQVDVDYISIPVTLSLKRRFSSRLEASFSLGTESRRYNEVHQDRNWGKPIAGLDITANLTPKTDSRLSVQREFYDSDVAAGYAFASTAADISLFLNLSGPVRLALRGVYSRNGYIELERSDNFFAGHGSIQYSLSRLGMLRLSYSHERRTSSVPTYHYRQHIIALSYVV